MARTVADITADIFGVERNDGARAKTITTLERLPEAAAPEQAPTSNTTTTTENVLAEIDAALRGLDALTTSVLREHFRIAELFAEAKILHEQETKTGHGKRNPQSTETFVPMMARRFNRSETWVYDYLALSKVDAATRDRISGSAIKENLAMMLGVAREPDPKRREAAIAAYDIGGSEAAKAALNRAASIEERAAKDAPFRAVVMSFLDEVNGMGKLRPEQAVPKGYVDVYPELQGLTVGEVRKVAGELGTRARTPKETKRAPKPVAPAAECPPLAPEVTPPETEPEPVPESVVADTPTEQPSLTDAPQQPNGALLTLDVFAEETDLKRMMAWRNLTTQRIQELNSGIPVNIMAKVLAESDAHVLGMRGAMEVSVEKVLDEQRGYVARVEYAVRYLKSHQREDHPMYKAIAAPLGHFKRLTLKDVAAAEDLVCEVANAIDDQNPFQMEKTQFQRDMETLCARGDALEAAEAAERGEAPDDEPEGTPTSS